MGENAPRDADRPKDATLPSESSADLYKKRLEAIATISDHAGKLFISMLLGCAYAWLTIAATSHVSLLTSAPSSKLPIVETEVPTVGFYVLTPLLLCGLYIYLHYYLQELWSELAHVSHMSSPDDRPLDENLHPWILNKLVCFHSEALRDGYQRQDSYPRCFSWPTRLCILCASLLAWGSVPFTLGYFWLQALARHGRLLTFLCHIPLLGLSGVLGIVFYSRAVATLRGKSSRNPSGKRLHAWFRSASPALGWSLVLGLLLVVVTLLSSRVIWAVPGPPNGDPATELARSANVANGHERRRANLASLFLSVPIEAPVEDPILQDRVLPGWILGLLQRINAVPFLDLREVDVSTKPAGWTGKKRDELALVKGANLNGRNLRFMQAFRAFLVNSQMERAHLEGADLQAAQLQGVHLDDAYLDYAFLAGAHLEGADLTRACFKGANLNLAVLKRTHLDRTDLAKADLDTVDLRGAKGTSTDLNGAILLKAHLEKSWFEKANLKNADLTDAHLQGAHLAGASLVNATLTGTLLEGADLQGADFQEAGIDVHQLRQALNYKLVFYSPAILDKLGLKRDHNKRLRDKDLRQYPLSNLDLRHANLQHFQLQGARFQGSDLRDAQLHKAELLGAHFQGANLQRAILQEANLQGAELQKARIDVRQLRQALNYKLAFYSPAILDSLGLKRDHNKRLRQKDLRNYTLASLDLRRANLCGFDLRGADLRRADLGGANLARADLRGTDLRKANLRGIVGLTRKQLAAARTDESFRVSPPLRVRPKTRTE